MCSHVCDKKLQLLCPQPDKEGPDHHTRVKPVDVAQRDFVARALMDQPDSDDKRGGERQAVQESISAANYVKGAHCLWSFMLSHLFIYGARAFAESAHRDTFTDSGGCRDLADLEGFVDLEGLGHAHLEGSGFTQETRAAPSERAWVDASSIGDHR